VGFALVVTSLPAVALSAAVGVTSEQASVTTWVGAALATPVTTVGGPAWAFHVATLTGLVGVWVVGLALVVEGTVE
jgi:uncharacterized membrane protein YcfT